MMQTKYVCSVTVSSGAVTTVTTTTQARHYTYTLETLSDIVSISEATICH